MQLPFLNKVSIRDKALFTRALAAMINAGLPIVKALGILSKQTENKILSKIIKEVVKKIESGVAFSQALAYYPEVFDNVYVSSVRAAEASGKFDEILIELADQQEKEYKLTSAIKSALAYPIVIVVAMVIAVVILMIVVVPKIEMVFKDADISLPITTKVLIATSNFMINYWYILAIILVTVIFYLRYYLRTQPGKLFLGGFYVNFPILKKFFVNVYMTRFSRTLAMLVNAGVPIVEALKIVSKVVDNIIYERILTKAARQLERGVPMSVPIAEADQFPAIVSQMIAVGEQTGKIDEVMRSLSEFFEEETEKSVNILTSLLEPILLIIVGLGVAVIVVSIIVPIYQISTMAT